VLYTNIFDIGLCHHYIWSALFLKNDLSMPNLSASKKSMRQSLKAKERNYKTRADLKKAVKDVLKAAKGDKAAAVTMLPKAFSVIDTAMKKNIIHKNNAARKKSLLARATA